MTQWFYPRGTLRRGPWETVVDQELPGWKHTGMRVADAKDAPEFHIAPDGIERVIYPGLASHPQHALAARQMQGFGGIVSVVLDGGLARAQDLDPAPRVTRLRITTLARPLRSGPAALPAGPDECGARTLEPAAS